LLSVAIVVIGVWLASLGNQIAAVTGAGASFVGTLLAATTTSLRGSRHRWQLSDSTL